MRGNVAERAFRIGIVVLALGVIVTAVLWVSAVRFKDEAGFWDCGVPIGAAWHGRQAPTLPLPAGTNPQIDHGTSGLFGVPIGIAWTKTVCAGQARTRVAIAAGAILVASAALVGGQRRRGPRQPVVAA